MIVVPFSQRPAGRALDMATALVQAATDTGAVCLAASLVEGPAVLLGAHQRAARVLDLAGAGRAAVPVLRRRTSGTAAVPVLRRRTSGTAAFVRRSALIFTLALPRVDALFADASPRTLLNRNVRPLLRGLTAAGGLAHYFGREWVSVHRRPAVLLGFDVDPGGAVLVEAIAGWADSMALPADLAAEDERAVDRFTGHAPAALADLLPAGATAESVARRVADAFAARASTPVREAEDIAAAGPDALATASIPPADDPLPEGAALLEPCRVPIGWLERALVPGRPALWLGGDVLAPRHLLDRISAAASGAPGEPPLELRGAELPLEGASLAELLDKARPQAA